MLGQQWKCFTLDYLKRPLKSFFTFFSHWKTSDLHLVPEDFYEEKNWIRELHKIIWKYSQLDYAEFCINTEKDYLCFY